LHEHGKITIVNIIQCTKIPADVSGRHSYLNTRCVCRLYGRSSNKWV